MVVPHMRVRAFSLALLCVNFFFLKIALTEPQSVLIPRPHHEIREDLIREAEKPNLTREGYIAVLRKIKERLPRKPYAAQNATDAQMLIDWIDGLDRLFEAGKLNSPARNFKFVTPHDDLIEISQIVTQGAATLINFTDYDDKNWDFVRTFYKWSEGYTRVFVADGQKYFVVDDIKNIKEPAKLRTRMKYWHVQLAKGCLLIAEIKNDARALGINYAINTRTDIDHHEAIGRVDSIVVGELLNRNAELIHPEVDELVRNCLSEPSIRKALKRLSMAALATKDSALTPKLVDWALILSEKLDDLENSGVDIDDGLRDQAGGIIITALKKQFESGQGYSIGSVEAILRRIEMSQQLDNLAYALVDVFRSRLLDENQLEFVYQLTLGLSQKVSDPYDQFEEFVQRTFAQKKRHELGWEGKYRIQIGGVDGVMTVAFTGAVGQNFVVTIRKLDSTGVSWSYTKVKYHRIVDANGEVHDVFEAYHENKSKSLTFELSGKTEMVRGKKERVVNQTNGKPVNILVNGMLERARAPRFFKFSGEQIQSLPTFNLRDQGVPWKPLDATFTGRSGRESVALRLKESGDDLSMALFYPMGVGTDIEPFPMRSAFIDRPKRLGFFTTDEQIDSSKIIQVRGFFLKDENTFIGFHLIGGDGFYPILLKKDWSLEESDETKKTIANFRSAVYGDQPPAR